MSLSDLTDPQAVFTALAEFDELGRDRFLSRYGFGKARSYFIVQDGRFYDSKAVAGAAHGYQHPELGPLRPADFSGGDATVRTRLEALGFRVEVTSPRIGPVPPLRLFEDYDRRDVRDIFAPEANFTPGAGLWGLSGIIEHQPGDFVLFVTIGQEQGEHTFDEGITTDGVVTRQSQPKQSLGDPQIQRLIAHDPARGNVRLFWRTRDASDDGNPMPYTYLGRLGYITHDAERERPVYFQWQLIDEWPPPEGVLAGMGLVLVASALATTPPKAPGPNLTETPPPASRTRSGERTPEFRARKAPDRSVQDAHNRALGVSGELAVLAREQEWLRANGRADLANQVHHVAALLGDGAGYDIKSFDLTGAIRFIEVKTTRGGCETDFYVSSNEVEFSVRHASAFCLYRVYDFDPTSSRGKFYVQAGSLRDTATVDLQPTQFRVRIIQQETDPV